MYLVDQKSGKRFHSRTDILWSTSKVSDLKVIYPEGYDSVDWTKEPDCSLSDLFYSRAIQLRDSYKYIILYFSGGSDSITVLNTFIKNNIYLDEVVVTCFSDIEDPKVDGKYALFYLKKINFKGKITVVNLTHDILNTINNKQLWYDWGYYTGLIHNLSRVRITWFEENNFINSSKRPSEVTHLYGGTTPLIKLINNKYYSEISAALLGIPSYYSGNEQFFTTPDFPLIHVKQSHVVLNYWKKNFPDEIVISESSYKEYKNYKIMKSLIRDEFNQSVSALKGGGKLNSLFRPNTETGSILSLYKSKDFSFFDRYVNSTIKEYAKTFQYKDNNGTFLDPSLNKRFYLSETTY